jgi:regulator of sirC expression with transglutaminase-like and TPR domain
MFFPRLRRQAKWVFVALAVVFALGFVGYGVGTGSNGISDLFNGIFGNGSSTSSVGKAQQRVKEHPNDPAALRALATALQVKGRQNEAIAPLQRYVKLRPSDASALSELASLQTIHTRQLALEAQNAQLAAQVAVGPNDTLFAFQLPGGSSLASDAITNAVQANATSTSQQLQQQALAAGKGAEATYLQLAQLQPDPTSELQLAQAAALVGDTTTAIGAYQRFLKLAPDDPNAPYVRKQLKQLLPSGSSG